MKLKEKLSDWYKIEKLKSTKNKKIINNNIC